jgi:hypothetical protein
LYFALVSGWGLLAGSCEFGDEPSGSGAMELVKHFSVVLTLTLKLKYYPEKKKIHHFSKMNYRIETTIMTTIKGIWKT